MDSGMRNLFLKKIFLFFPVKFDETDTIWDHIEGDPPDISWKSLVYSCIDKVTIALSSTLYREYMGISSTKESLFYSVSRYFEGVTKSLIYHEVS